MAHFEFVNSASVPISLLYSALQSAPEPLCRTALASQGCGQPATWSPARLRWVPRPRPAFVGPITYRRHLPHLWRCPHPERAVLDYAGERRSRAPTLTITLCYSLLKNDSVPHRVPCVDRLEHRALRSAHRRPQCVHESLLGACSVPRGMNGPRLG
jgi:hypothetical protein